jgi:hypothetical protein
VEIARNPQSRVRDISAAIGITERATQAIIADLERAGYVERVRTGRRTRYVLHPDSPFRHSAQDGLQVGPFLDLLTGTASLTDPASLVGTASLIGTDPLAGVDPLASAPPLAGVAPLADPVGPSLPTPAETVPPLTGSALPEPGPH